MGIKTDIEGLVKRYERITFLCKNLYEHLCNSRDLLDSREPSEYNEVSKHLELLEYTYNQVLQLEREFNMVILPAQYKAGIGSTITDLKVRKESYK